MKGLAMTGSRYKLRDISSCIVALVVLLQTGFQTTMILERRAVLTRFEAGQEAAVKESGFQKSDLGKVIQGVLNLARDGNKNVLPVIAELKRSGLVTEQPRP